MVENKSFDAAVVGGGFYGCYLARALARGGRRVVLFEAESDLMTRASFNNQARVHGGYHYPRSFNTARRARALMPSFVEQFRGAVHSEFRSLYAISNTQSKITARMFEEIMRTAGAPLEATDDSLFVKNSVERVYLVEEPVFDAAKLRALIRQDLNVLDVTVQLQTTVDVTSPGRLRCAQGEFKAKETYLCAYADTNKLLRASGLPAIALENQWTEICLVRLPAEFAALGITVMDGPFFSLLPFPARNCHSLTHVNYTRHLSWAGDRPAELPRQTAFPKMIRDAARWIPAMAKAEYIESLWEVKTLLPQTADSQGRPILYLRDYAPDLHVILGAKIDTALELQ